MHGEESVMESRAIIWVEQIVHGGHREKRLVTNGWHGAAVEGGRGRKSVGVERRAGGGAVGICYPTQKYREVLRLLRFSAG